MCQAQMFTCVSGTFRTDVWAVYVLLKGKIIYLTLDDQFDPRNALYAPSSRTHIYVHIHLDSCLWVDGANTLTQYNRPVYMLVHTDAPALHYTRGFGWSQNVPAHWSLKGLCIQHTNPPVPTVKVVTAQHRHVYLEKDWVSTYTGIVSFTQIINTYFLQELILRCVWLHSEWGTNSCAELHVGKETQ